MGTFMVAACITPAYYTLS